jgi:hypothetical protein
LEGESNEINCGGGVKGKFGKFEVGLILRGGVVGVREGEEEGGRKR